MAFDFPNSPATGDTFQGYTWDGEKWVQTFNAPNTSGVIAIKVFTASGTYTPSANMTTCVIEAVGGGGGGGGGTSTAGQTGSGGGGGGGGYSRKLVTAAIIGASQIVTVGAGGNGGAAGNNNGTAGGDTSVGTLCIAKGASPGSGSVTGFASTAGNGGISGTGDFATVGNNGGQGIGGSIITLTSISGFGANGPFGGGVQGVGAGNSNGLPGTAPGAGGSGGGAFNGSNAAGGAGAPGLVVITEYGMTALSSSTIASGAVRFDLPQGLSGSQQTQGRSNIGAVSPVGVTDGSNATAGNVGELVEASAALSTVSLTSLTPVNITSISLTAGDWDVYGTGYYTTTATTTITLVQTSTGTTSATIDASPGHFGEFNTNGATLGSGVFSVSPGQPKRYSLTTPTTVFLTSNQQFGASTLSAGGKIRARRIR